MYLLKHIYLPIRYTVSIFLQLCPWDTGRKLTKLKRFIIWFSLQLTMLTSSVTINGRLVPHEVCVFLLLCVICTVVISLGAERVAVVSSEGFKIFGMSEIICMRDSAEVGLMLRAPAPTWLLAKFSCIPFNYSLQMRPVQLDHDVYDNYYSIITTYYYYNYYSLTTDWMTEVIQSVVSE